MSERKAKQRSKPVTDKRGLPNEVSNVQGPDDDINKKGVIVNSAKLDPINPIPFESGNTQYFLSGKEQYLPFLTAKDDFAITLLEARMLSSTHDACIDTKGDYCAGDDMIDAEGGEVNSVITDWFGSMNLKNESISKINKKIFDSHFTFGNTPIELVRFKVGEETRFFVYVHNFLEWRLCAPNDDDICDFAIQSKLFLRKRRLTLTDVSKAKKLPIYNPRKTEKQNWQPDENNATVERTLVWYKNEKTGYDYYGMPGSVASLTYQVAEYKGIRYNLDGFDNNWTASAIVTLKGTVAQSENLRIAKNLVDTHTGDGKRGRTVVLSSEQGMEGTEVEQLDTEAEGSFLEADAAWTQKIIFAHKWDAVLAGLVTSSTLGKGAGFITKIFEIKQTTVIIPAQNDLLKCVWKDIFVEVDKWLNLGVSKRKWKIKTSANINALSDVDVTPVVTVDEVRTANNLPELEDKVKGKLLVGEIKQKQGANSNQNSNTSADNVPA